MDPYRAGRGESKPKKQQCQGSNPGARSASHREHDDEQTIERNGYSVPLFVRP